MMEWRIATAGLIEYSGDLMTPPDAAKVHIHFDSSNSYLVMYPLCTD